MTLFPSDDAATPDLPGVGPLAMALHTLLRDARATGKRQSRDLTSGLRVEVFEVEHGLGIGLSRLDSAPSAQEVDTVAREAGLTGYQVERNFQNGRRWATLRPDSPATAGLAAKISPEEQAQYKAVLKGPGPWRNAILPDYMQQARDAALKKMELPELLDEWNWAGRHWPEARAAALAGLVTA